MSKNKSKISNKVIFMIVSIVVVVVAVITMAFYFNSTKLKEEYYVDKLNGGDIYLTYTDESNEFLINEMYPLTDAEGTIQDSADKYFDFTVNSEIDNANFLEYEIVVNVDEFKSKIKPNNIKIYLEKQNSGTFESVFGPETFEKEDSQNMVVYKQKVKNNTKENFRLRMWVKDDAVLAPETLKDFGVSIEINAKAS